MELTRLKRKLVTARRGHKLLKDKRDELMRQVLDMVRENKSLREEVEEKISQANKNFVLASASVSAEVLRSP
jgi:V/A-type H+-transporting ATPase subunit D